MMIHRALFLASSSGHERFRFDPLSSNANQGISTLPKIPGKTPAQQWVGAAREAGEALIKL